jgi:hypothetical protein
MKPLKIAIVALIAAFVLVGVASADDITIKPKQLKVIPLTFAKAMSMPGLVNAMNEQLSIQDFLDNTQLIYVAEVTFEGSLYRISGTRYQWIRFFLLQADWPVNIKNQVIGIN